MTFISYLINDMFVISTVGPYVRHTFVSRGYQNEMSRCPARPFGAMEWFGSRLEMKMMHDLRGSAHNRDAGSAALASFGPNTVLSRQNAYELKQSIINIIAHIYMET